MDMRLPEARKTARLRQLLKAPYWLLTGQALRKVRLWRHARVIRRSGLFDQGYYLQHYPDVAAANLDSVVHYVTYGAAEGRNPHPLFDTSFYLQQNPDVARAKVNPLFHFVRHGAREGRDPHPLFDTSVYLKKNPDVAKAGVNPLSHYLIHGAAEGRDPHGGVPGAVEEALGQVRNRLERDPTVLDWNSGLGLARVLSRLAVFSPPGAADVQRLPYLDGTVDVVVLSSADPVRVAEARRVAAAAVLRLSGLRAGDATAEGFRLEWKPEATAPPSLPGTSIIVPAHDKASYTDACLKQLLATLPRDFRGEIIVVDDASTDETPAVLDRWAASSALVRRLRNAENLGFLRSCNRAAEAASGEVLVFLNNDTLPQPGWLPPLLRLLRDQPGAGAVGGKLVYPDGTLQEAGGVIFSDASGCNFGKYDADVNAPLYSYVREVDFCSGALLAIPRTLFLELGGFDLRFSPAYYEDVDLCFRLRESGYRVYYQPESVVIHYEGVSSGTDTSRGVKRCQVINREKFKEKWGESLRRQPPPPERYDAATLHALSVRDDRPRALVCAPRMPEYDREAGSRRIFHLLEFLQEAGWAVSFVAQDATASERYARVLQQLGVATYAGSQAALVGDEYLETIDELIAPGQFDLAILAFWNIGEELLPRIRSLSPARGRPGQRPCGRPRARPLRSSHGRPRTLARGLRRAQGDPVHRELSASTKRRGAEVPVHGDPASARSGRLGGTSGLCGGQCAGGPGGGRDR